MSNRKPKMVKYTKKDFERQFPNDAACLEWLKNYLYPDGIYCIKCEAMTLHHRVKSRPSYSCDHCGHHVHPTADTIFHKSPTPLTTWFYAIYLMASTRCGISAKQIERETGVTYKTAWRMFKQIRSMLNESDGKKLGGKCGPGVEMDETYMGGVQKMGAGRKPRNPKTPVFGIAERRGRVRAFTTDNVQGATLLPIIREHVLPKSTIFTDERVVYDGVGHTSDGYWHRRIRHREKVYVMGNVHTNTVEGFWSLVKRGISGVYHNVGRHYLQSYLNEYSFRYNRRFDEQPMFTSFLGQIEKQNTINRVIPAEVSEPF